MLGMFEIREGNMHEPYNGINSDIYSWKEYKITELITNSHGLLEIDFDLSDATLRGTSEHTELMTEVVNRY